MAEKEGRAEEVSSNPLEDFDVRLVEDLTASIIRHQTNFWLENSGIPDGPDEAKVLRKIMTQMPYDMIVAGAWIRTAFAVSQPNGDIPLLFPQAITSIATTYMVCLSCIRRFYGEEFVSNGEELVSNETEDDQAESSDEEEAGYLETPVKWKTFQVTKLCCERKEQIINYDFVKNLLEQLETLCRKGEIKLRDRNRGVFSSLKNDESRSLDNITGSSEAVPEYPILTAHPEWESISTVLASKWGRAVAHWILETMKIFSFSDVPQKSELQGCFVYYADKSERSDYEMSSRKRSDSSTDLQSAESSSPGPSRGTLDGCSTMKTVSYSSAFTFQELSNTLGRASESSASMQHAEDPEQGNTALPFLETFMNLGDLNNTSQNQTGAEGQVDTEGEHEPSTYRFLQKNIEGIRHAILCLLVDTQVSHDSNIPVQPQFSLLVQLLNYAVEVRRTVIRMINLVTVENTEALFLCLSRCLTALKLAAALANNLTKLDFPLSRIYSVSDRFNTPFSLCPGNEADQGSEPEERNTSERYPKRRSPKRRAAKRQYQSTDNYDPRNVSPSKVAHRTAADPSASSATSKSKEVKYSMKLDKDCSPPPNIEISSDCQTSGHSASNVLEVTDHPELPTTQDSSSDHASEVDALTADSPNAENYDVDHSDTN